jgi:putative transposase
LPRLREAEHAPSAADSQIIGYIKRAEVGEPVPALCREGGFSAATFYKWRSKCAGMDVSMMARVKELEEDTGV